MIACALLPRLTLRAALGGRPDRLREPVATAPPDGGPGSLGEVSPAALELGVRPGMRLGEALDICPALTLVQPDPLRARDLHERLLQRVEAIGAGVESGRPGEVFFPTGGIERLHGGVDGVLAATRRSLGPEPALAAADTRLAALSAARSLDPGETSVLPRDRLIPFLAGLPVEVLSGRLGLPPGREARFFRTLRRLQLHRLGDLTGLSADRIADRFGPPGSRARKLAAGLGDRDIRPRSLPPAIRETVTLPEASTHAHLLAGLTALCDRVAARLDAAGLAARVLAFEAELTGEGSWSRTFVPRRPTSSPALLETLLSPVPEQLPRPAAALGLHVTAPVPAVPEQLEAGSRPEETRRLRLNEAVRQVKAAAGSAGLMRVIEADSGSRLPERRVLLGPYLPE